MVDYHILETMQELEQVVDLEIKIWDLPPRDAVPANVMHPIVLNGGVVVGAYEDHLIGMTLAFPVRRGDKWLLWSHMTGVHPKYQNKGIGFGLKQMQRQWALKAGYDTISWTFDPLQRGNANFNIRQLGATSSTYHVNFYGDMIDGINAGLPSDRLEVTWKLKDPKVEKLAKGKTLSPTLDNQDLPSLLQIGSNGKPFIGMDTSAVGKRYKVEIPYELASIKTNNLEVAYNWRVALRQVLQGAFSLGYVVTDFQVLQGHCWYVLSAPNTWFLYVIECVDKTFYTGITLDVERRLKQHNAGQGAIYTKSRRPVQLIASWCFVNRSQALKAENRFKQFTREKKINIVSSKDSFEGGYFIEVG